MLPNFLMQMHCRLIVLQGTCALKANWCGSSHCRPQSSVPVGTCLVSVPHRIGRQHWCSLHQWKCKVTPVRSESYMMTPAAMSDGREATVVHHHEVSAWMGCWQRQTSSWNREVCIADHTYLENSFFSNLRAVRMCVSLSMSWSLIMVSRHCRFRSGSISILQSFGSYQCSCRSVVQQLYKAPTKHLEDLPSHSTMKHSRNIVPSWLEARVTAGLSMAVHLEDLPSQSMIKHSRNIVASSDCRHVLLPVSPWQSTTKRSIRPAAVKGLLPQPTHRIFSMRPKANKGK